jgi:threonine dehydrogenase-like Zn-dependent dehydrogenase
MHGEFSGHSKNCRKQPMVERNFLRMKKTSSMKALFFDGAVLKEITAPQPRRSRNEALIKVHLAGICSTDLEIVRGYMSFRGIPGHEFVGTVVSASTKKFLGTRVVGEINISCGKCPACRSGLAKHCPRRSVLGIAGRSGAFAEYLILPENNLHAVPPHLTDEEAAFTELVAAACEIPERIRIHRGDRVLVLGDGRLAAMAAQVLATKTNNLAMLGVNRRKLSVMRTLGFQAQGASRTSAFLRRQDFVIDCTGSPEGLPFAAELVRPQGTIVLKSTYHGQLEWNPASIVVDEITVTGSRCGPFDKALALIEKGTVKVLPFLTAVYPFDRWETAFRRARRADAFKVLMRME